MSSLDSSSGEISDWTCRIIRVILSTYAYVQTSIVYMGTYAPKKNLRKRVVP